MLGADEILKYANVGPFFWSFNGWSFKKYFTSTRKPTNESEKIIRSAF